LRILFDLETNGLLDRPDLKILCGAAVDVDTGAEALFVPDHTPRANTIEVSEAEGGFNGPVYANSELPRFLGQATALIGHNIAGFDIPLLWQFWPDMPVPDEIIDTRSWSRLAFIDTVLERTAAFRNSAGRSEEAREAQYPKRLMAPDSLHKLESWGHRLGFRKGRLLKDLGVQEEYSDELLEYCLRDVRLNRHLYRWLAKNGGRKHWPVCSKTSVVAESRAQLLVSMQERNGVGFNEKDAAELYATLAAEREEIGRKLREQYFPAWWAPKPVPKPKDGQPPLKPLEPIETRFGDAAFVVPARTYKVPYPNHLAGRAAGCPFTPVQLIEFNPASRDHIADRLQKVYGWKPKAFGDDGVPTLDEQVLSDLNYPPIPLISRLLTLSKVIGMLAEGKSAWLKCVKDGRIHGRVMTTGARTSRMSHSKPNLGQVPAVDSPFGPECRGLFRPTRPGWWQVGADASGIELRFLAHHLARWDGGAFAGAVLEGDPHTDWMRFTGFKMRPNQKRGTYAFLYGAGDPKLGEIFIDDWRMAYEKGLVAEKPPKAKFAKALGADVRSAMLLNVVGLDPLLRILKRAFRQGYLVDLDGAVIAVKSEHGALNDLLQGDAARLMKHALWLKYKKLLALGYRHGVDFAFMLNVHDEWQNETPDEERAHVVGRTGVEAIRDAGAALEVRCALDGEYKVGRNWKETH
jgi:DNA polymerase-1